MADRPYDFYIDLVTKQYFHSVDNYNMDETEQHQLLAHSRRQVPGSLHLHER